MSFPVQHLLFGSLGCSLACADPPEPERLAILNEAWKVVTKVRSPLVSAQRSLARTLYFDTHIFWLLLHVLLFHILCLQDYINCAEIWVEFTCRHFTVCKTQ